MSDKPKCVCPDSPCPVHSGTYRFDRAKRFGRPDPMGYWGDSGPDPLRPEPPGEFSGPLIAALGKTLDDAEAQMEFVLTEAGEEIGVFDSVAAAKHELQTTWGEGQLLEWKREVRDGKRVLVHEQFTIYSRQRGGD